ncbi:hypothetical protein M8C21_028287 [Ambrosia artemisiifolia]|uniref:Uncharacterized protein n=1 Tax=Ambrosia artemisiifolia TaxID=4212 RepID=A0AAD5GUN2_AMBAR|nr:hypothetical protein M8C21_028287 [Ambrosia artemisiifolia]
MCGSIWSDPVHDQDWMASILAYVKPMKNRYPAFDKISAILTTISEISCDQCWLCISGTHVNPLGLKSDGAMDVIWDIMRCWVKNHPVKEQSPDQSGSVILAKELANFAQAVASLGKAQSKKVARFLPNPERYWGQKHRAGRTITSKHVSLLGADAVNGVLNNNDQEAEVPQVKRQKTGDPTSISCKSNNQEPDMQNRAFYLCMKLPY